VVLTNQGVLIEERGLILQEVAMSNKIGLNDCSIMLYKKRDSSSGEHQLCICRSFSSLL